MTEWPLQIDALTDPSGKRILDGSNRPQAVIKVLNASTLPDALRNIKAAVDAARHPEVDDAINRKMNQFAWRVYSWEFASSIRPLNDALKQAQIWQIQALAAMLWIANITQAGAIAQRNNIATLSTTPDAPPVAPPTGITQAAKLNNSDTRIGSITQAWGNIARLNSSRVAMIDATVNATVNPKK